MANLMDFVKDKDFSTDSEADPFPEGKTKLEVAEIEVQEHEVEFDGKKRMRYILKAGDKQYWAGNQIMQGIQAAVEAGFETVEITRKGQGLKTKYTVMGLQK
jgi:hypothetical protein